MAVFIDTLFNIISERIETVYTFRRIFYTVELPAGEYANNGVLLNDDDLPPG
jgi:hypothetical protein